MTEAFEKAKKALSVTSVTLRDSYVALNDDIDLKDFDTSDADIQTFRGVQKVRETSIQSEEKEFWEYHFYYGCGIRLVNEENPDLEEITDALVEIRATFNATYRSDKKVDKELIEAFSEENVGYHVWPYWRELVQSSCSRLCISTIETPLYFCTSK
ncbi:hypothetical protein AADZ86_15665 [Colwelliaceae bacterium BS250]